MSPTKENTLFLIVKQAHFDAVLSGSQKQEVREINYTAYKRYLKTWEEGDDVHIYYDEDKISLEELQKYPNNPMIYNNGVYPYLPIDYQFLNLAVGYNKERDRLTTTIEDIHFQTIKTKNGNDARYSDDGERMIIDDKGPLCIWEIVYSLGKIVKTDLMTDRK